MNEHSRRGKDQWKYLAEMHGIPNERLTSSRDREPDPGCSFWNDGGFLLELCYAAPPMSSDVIKWRQIKGAKLGSDLIPLK